jgi:mono/diheme cytochrome c family protein
VNYYEYIKTRRLKMKRLFVAFILILFTAPTVCLADGGSDYKAKCAACHGAKVNLLPKTARLLKVDPKKLALKASQMNREEMIAITEKGKNKMPGFEKEMTKDQITSIIDYIMALRKK